MGQVRLPYFPIRNWVALGLRVKVDLCGIGEIVPNTILRFPLTSGRGWVQLHLEYRSTTFPWGDPGNIYI